MEATLLEAMDSPRKEQREVGREGGKSPNPTIPFKQSNALDSGRKTAPKLGTWLAYFKV